MRIEDVVGVDEGELGMWRMMRKKESGWQVFVNGSRCREVTLDLIRSFIGDSFVVGHYSPEHGHQGNDLSSSPELIECS